MQSQSTRPDPEVAAKATRRRFSAAEKARILDEYEKGSAIERAALLRREHIYSSHIANWRRQSAAGKPLETKRGRKPDPEGVENTRLRKENEKLQERLAKAERGNRCPGKSLRALACRCGRERGRDGSASLAEQAVMELASEIGERDACKQVGLARATFRRHHELAPPAEMPIEPLSRQQRRYQARIAKREQLHRERKRSSLALDESERQSVLDAVHQERFVDRSVPYIYATLLDEGTRYGSMSTMYRILHSVGEIGERRDQATRPARVKPELCASGPNQVYAWDITKLHGPQKWTYYYLYVIIDIYSRCVVGWMVADRESSELARLLLGETILKHGADPTKLVVHADNGSSMASKPVAFLLADLGVTKSHSRPHVSNDNPHIESFFKTTKYQPEFPATFSNLANARAFCRTFMGWYNNEHRHSAIALLTPADVHYGRAKAKLEKRQTVLDAAYAANPERFVHGKPKVQQIPAASYINKPIEIDDAA